MYKNNSSLFSFIFLITLTQSPLLFCAAHPPYNPEDYPFTAGELRKAAGGFHDILLRRVSDKNPNIISIQGYSDKQLATGNELVELHTTFIHSSNAERIRLDSAARNKFPNAIALVHIYQRVWEYRRLWECQNNQPETSSSDPVREHGNTAAEEADYWETWENSETP